MKFLAVIMLAGSFWSMFGMEPVQKDDISVYEDAKNEYYKNQSESRSQSKSEKTYKSKGDELNKGYVYGNDELHVTETPSDSRGYTAAGYYGSDELGGKGWVYGCDELHVTGLPTDPETGYTLPGFYGEIK